MTNTSELLMQARKEEIWMKYCGFLDLELEDFMDIQERLLMEQLSFLRESECEITRKFIGGNAPKDVAEFRKVIPVTTYEDYSEFLDEKRDDVLPREPVLWAHTSGRSGSVKWVPYTKPAYDKLGERVLTGVILAAARRKGDVRLQVNDTLVYNTPPRPYISGVCLRALADQFDFRFVPPLEETEDMDFQERIETGFKTGLRTGIDILGSLAVVLVKMGERFTQGAQTTRVSPQMLHPRVFARLVRGWLRSKLERRSMLPKDLWHIKAIPSGGMDTSLYRDRIAYYWGVVPYEQYGSTEEGSLATQTWTKKDMTFFPDAAFLEFIPEEEWAKWRRDPTYSPETVLMDEVEPGKRYEVVVTNFYGKPLVRYRMHDVIRFTSLQDEEAGIRLPQMSFVGRSSDFIDLAGFAGLIDEKMVWQSIIDSGVEFEEWAIRKETRGDDVILHLYIELSVESQETAETVRDKVNSQMKDRNRFYADYESIIVSRPLEVTLLGKGSYQSYMAAKSAQGADLAHLKPPHMNASDTDIGLLLEKSGELTGSQ